jgi:hypothetical protein
MRPCAEESHRMNCTASALQHSQGFDRIRLHSQSWQTESKLYAKGKKKTYNFYHLSWLHAISTFSIIRRKKIQYPKQRTTAAKWTTRMPKEAMAWDLQKWCTIGFSDLFPQFRTPALVASYTPFYLQPNPVQCLTTLQGPGNTNDTRYYQNCRRSTNNWINQSNKRQ